METEKTIQSSKILNLIENLLKRLCVAYENIEITEDSLTNNPCYVIRTKDSKILIGNHGANIGAFNHIVKQVARKQFSEVEMPSSFLIDVNGYYGRRIDEIAYQTKISAERVRMFKRDVDMLPMSAYERLLIHSYFQNIDDITTESQGEGKFRHVVLKLSIKNSPTNPFLR